MYCINCGKENPDGVKFCCFCGTKTYIAPRPAEEISVIIPQNPVENGQLDFSETEAISEKIDENPQIPEPISPADLPKNPISSNNSAYPKNPLPYPQPINHIGASPAQEAAQTVPTMNVPMKTAVSEEKQNTVRTFTLKHIIMCLISTAVCAIAAGIFAGLYFSVI